MRVRIVCAVYEVLPRGAGTVLVSLYGLVPWLTLAPARRERARLLAVATHANARRHVRSIALTLGDAQVDELRMGLAALLTPETLVRCGQLRPSPARRTFRLLHRINRRGDFLVSCRVASLIGCYARARQLLEERRPAGVLVSSDSNPEEVGLVSAARARAVPSIFVSHAYTTTVSPRLNFTLSILEGEAAVSAYARKGPMGGSIFLAGVEGPSHPMEASRLERPAPSIGIFAPKAVKWPVMSAMIDDCRTRFGARQILIRWHPSMIERPKLASVLGDVSGIVETPRTAQLAEIARQCDWVLADTASNVHLQVLKLGIPTIAVSGMGVLQEDQTDLYGFVAARVVLPPVAALRDLSVPDAVAFYDGDWATRFGRFDASYLRSSEDVFSGLVTAIDRVLATTPRDTRQ